MTRKPLDRRMLLRGVGGIAIALPWLEIMGCSRPDGTQASADKLGATAQRITGSPGLTADGLPRRFITIATPNGTLPDLWFPQGGETDFQLGPLHESLQAYRNEMILMKGIENFVDKYTGHAAQPVILTGSPTDGPTEQSMSSSGPSLDYVLGARIAENETSRPPYRNLVLGTNTSVGVYSALTYAGAGQPLPNRSVAGELFDELFSTGASTPDEAARLRAKHRSILDGAMSDGLALSKRLGAQDRMRLEAHLDAIREIEQRFTRAGGCEPSGLVPGDKRDQGRELPEMMSQMLDVLALAMSCDMSRVATYMVRSEGQGHNDQTFGWLGIGPSGDPYGSDADQSESGTDHHVMSHHDTTARNRDYLTRVNQWFMLQIAGLVERLKALPEGNGTVFDNSVILYGSAIGQGNHYNGDIPYMLLGSCGGALRTGRYFEYDKRSNADLLVALMNAMGVEGDTFGDPATCQGALPGLLA